MLDMYENEDRGELNNALEKFNWGAFGFSFIWAPFNGAWKEFWPVFVIMIFFAILSNFFLGPIFIILNILLCIYCGKKGNEWAWYGKEWKSLEQFENTQKKWGIGFIVLLIINILITLIIMAVGVLFAKSLTNPKVQQKIVGSAIVMPLSKDPQFKSAKNSEELVDLYVKLWNQSKRRNSVAKKYSEDSVLIYYPNGSSYEQILTFYKSGECSMDKKNCYLILNKKHGETITPITKTYFDFNGQTFVVNLKK